MFKFIRLLQKYQISMTMLEKKLWQLLKKRIRILPVALKLRQDSTTIYYAVKEY